MNERAEAQPWSRVNVPPTAWDDPVCTEGVVSVTRGAPAKMTCNISNPFLHVSVCLRAPGWGDCQRGGDCRAVFTQAAPGCSSGGGWRLCVEGPSARMVTEEARDSQAGEYRWTLVGGQTEQLCTTLNVSGEGRGLNSPQTWGGPPLPSLQSLRFLSMSSATPPHTLSPGAGASSPTTRPVPLLP